MPTPSLLHLDAERLVPKPPERTVALQNSIDRLFERINYERVAPGKYDGSNFELSRMGNLLARLNDPHLATPCVHIAGTKGKGSTASLTASVLAAAGYTTGLFTSPHIHDFEERVTVNRTWAEPAVYEQSFAAVWAAVEQMDETGEHATYFEITTALAWDVFRRTKCDIAVVEVGLGGRLDSTNLCSPLVTAITSISRDHSKLLGDTLAAIAREKAGIYKKDVPTVSGVDRNTSAVVQDIAKTVGCELWQLGREIAFDDPVSEPLATHCIAVTTPRRVHEQVPVALPGPHQSRNTALVVAICDLLNESFPIRDDDLQSGLANADCPLRIEVVASRPTVVLDAAHNGASIAALVETLRPIKANKRWLIFGSSRDKHVDDMLDQLASRDGEERFADEVLITEFSTNPRALPCPDLAALTRASLGEPVRVVESPTIAIETALREASVDDLIVVTGSFFLATEIREYFIKAAQSRSHQPSADAAESPA